MNHKLLIGSVVVIALGLFLFGRFQSDVNNRVSSHSVQTNLAPDFTLQKLGGGTISLSEFRGKKPVVVDFWASWCPNCRRDVPKLSRFYEKYKDKVEVIGINLQESESTVEKFTASNNVTFPIALDLHGQVSRTFGIQYTNTHLLIDINGNFVRMIPGDIRESDITSLIDQASSLNDQSYLSEEQPCKIAFTQDGEAAGVCENSRNL